MTSDGRNRRRPLDASRISQLIPHDLIGFHAPLPGTPRIVTPPGGPSTRSTPGYLSSTPSSVDPSRGNMIIHHELIIDRSLLGRDVAPKDARHHADGVEWEGTRLRNGASGQGSNSVQVRHYNERVILTLLRRLGEASKADLARHARLTSNTAGQIVRELEEQRLVRADGKRTGARGQPATILRLDPTGAYSIGFKLGRRSMDAMLVDFGGHVHGAPASGAGVPDARGSRGVCRRERRRAASPDGRLECWSSRRTRRRHALQSRQLAARARHPAGRLSAVERVRSARRARGARPASTCSARTTARRRRWPSCSRATTARSTNSSTSSSVPRSAAACCWAATIAAASTPMPATSA